MGRTMPQGVFGAAMLSINWRIEGGTYSHVSSVINHPHTSLPCLEDMRGCSLNVLEIEELLPMESTVPCTLNR